MPKWISTIFLFYVAVIVGTVIIGIVVVTFDAPTWVITLLATALGYGIVAVLTRRKSQR